MEDSSPRPMDVDKTATDASNFLLNLPSRGLFSPTVLSANPGGMRIYMCEHDTNPPEDQHIKTNQQNLLVRALVLKKQKGFTSSRGAKAAAVTKGSRKRNGQGSLDSKASAKRANSRIGSGEEGSNSLVSDSDFRSMTVERLRALLKERCLSLKGKKDELIDRLKATSS